MMMGKSRLRNVVTAVVILAIPIVAAVTLLPGTQPPDPVRIDLSSEPFPLAVGPSTLLVSVSAGGAPVVNATVEITGESGHSGMPLSASSSSGEDGEYRLALTVPRTGSWTFEVTATLPDQPDPVREQFDVYVYPIPQRSHASAMTYRSASERNALLQSQSSDELWIVIPQGTEAMMRAGQGDDIIPEEIRLWLDGQDVLVIRNDDIAHHNVGPFFVQAGETIRQEFSSPTVLQGACSINHGAEVNIIVERERNG